MGPFLNMTAGSKQGSSPLEFQRSYSEIACTINEAFCFYEFSFKTHYKSGNVNILKIEFLFWTNKKNSIIR